MAKSPTSIDRRIGYNIRVLREMRHRSQKDLAGAIGVAYQQVQKYEAGTDRVGAGRLLEIANYLDVPVADFFDGARPVPSVRKTEGRNSTAKDLLLSPYALKMLRVFCKIEDLKLRLHVIELLESAAQEQDR
jgi:transcriptional regulator with XRE-family HTH domain